MLAQRGLARGDMCRWCLETDCRRSACLLGAMYAGCCVHPVNLLSQPEQMHYVVDHSDARVVFAAPDWGERVRVLTADIARPIDVIDSRSGRARPLPGENAESMPATAIEPAPDALALLMYTSGTTGKPKGVMLTQANLAENAQAISREHQLEQRDRVLPFCRFTTSTRSR